MYIPKGKQISFPDWALMKVPCDTVEGGKKSIINDELNNSKKKKTPRLRVWCVFKTNILY